MAFIENEQTEFKRELGPSVIKSIIAFANTRGGTLYIGVDDSGVAVGFDNVDQELTRLTSMMRDQIRPDILMMTSCEVESIDGVEVIVVHVGRGVKRPYYLASKGPVPQGVYVRSGAASLPASTSSILHMIREGEESAFEACVSLEQNLSFEYAKGEFSKKQLPFEEAQMRTLGLVNASGAFTNLALLLSDQCPGTIKFAAFDDNDRSVFTERAEFSGSILKQLADAYGLLDSHNHYTTQFAGLERTDFYDYPAVALREALVNSVAHREYALSGPTLVSVVPSGVEIVSLGGLPAGIEEEDLQAHVSVPRNRMLANVLFRLELIEAYGTGLGRIRQSYKTSAAGAQFSITSNTFSVKLPNRNEAARALSARGATGAADVLRALEGRTLSRLQLQEELGISQTTLLRLLSALVEEGKVAKTGSGKTTKYSLA